MMSNVSTAELMLIRNIMKVLLYLFQIYEIQTRQTVYIKYINVYTYVLQHHEDPILS